MQVCYTGRFEAYLPRWSIFRRASPLMQIVIDRERQILYTRSQSGAIGVSCLHAAYILSIYAQCNTKAAIAGMHSRQRLFLESYQQK